MRMALPIQFPAAKGSNMPSNPMKTHSCGFVLPKQYRQGADQLVRRKMGCFPSCPVWGQCLKAGLCVNYDNSL